MLDNGSVRNLTEIEIPPEVIVVLGKGLGFVPTPRDDSIELQLEARRLTNNIINDINKRSRDEDLNVEENFIVEDTELIDSSFSLPGKLRQTSYYQKSLNKPTAERNFILQQVKESLNKTTKKRMKKSKKVNLSFYERQGLDWLTKKVMKEEIFIT